jgi:hypothetical protein
MLPAVRSMLSFWSRRCLDTLPTGDVTEGLMLATRHRNKVSVGAFQRDNRG